MENGILRVVSPDRISEQEALEDQARANISSDETKVELTELISHIRKEFQSARDSRYTTGVSKRLIDALRTYKAEYTPEKLAEIQTFGGSDAYSRVTSSKCRAATAMMRDLYLSASDEPWVLEPTPDPTLPDDMANSIQAMVMAEAQMLQAQGQPVTEEIIRERITQLKEQGEMATVKKAHEDAITSTKKLRDITIEGGYNKAIREFLIDLPIFPIACIKGPVVKNVAKTRWVNGKAEMTYEARMHWQRVSPLDLYFTPDAGNVEQSYVIEHVKFSKQDLAALIGVPGYRDDDIRATLEAWDGARQSQDWRDWFETEREDLESREYWTSRGKLIDAIEFHGVVAAEMLAEYDVIPKKDEYDAAELYMVDAWIVDNHLLKVQLNPALNMVPPYYVTSFEKIPGSIYGYGLPDMLGDIQSVCNASMRNLVNNMAMSSGPQVVVNDDRLAPGESGNEMYPWKRWHVQDHPDGNKSLPPISFFQPDSRAQELMGIYEKFSTMADEASALPRYMTGGTAGGAGRTASGLAMLMDNASKVMQNVAANVDDDILTPSIERLYELVMLTQGDEEIIRGDETIQVRGVTVAVQRETDRMRKLEFLQMTGNPIDMEIIGSSGRAEVLRDVSHELGMDGKKIVPSAGELKQQAAAKQQEMQKQQALEMASEGGSAQLPAPQQARDPAMQARQPQENVTRGIAQ